MKVYGTQEIGPRLPVKDPARSSIETLANGTPVADTVETLSPQLTQAAKTAQATEAMRHERRVDTIASQVRLGTYTWPSPQLIADKLLDSQQLTAHLRSLLQP
jgi:anti-sigma28 factor (negative regulator of flagellin synthesis)